MALLLIAVLILSIPTCGIAFLIYWLVRRQRRRRLERSARLNGGGGGGGGGEGGYGYGAGRGDVDDPEFARALGSETAEWITRGPQQQQRQQQQQQLGTGAGAGAGGDGFDPLADWAEKQRKRKERRRRVGAGDAEPVYSSASGSHSGGSSDDERGARIYATTLANDVGAGGAASPLSPAAGATFDSKALDLSAQTGVDRYPGPAPAAASSSPSTGGSPALSPADRHRREESRVFEDLLNAAGSPVLPPPEPRPALSAGGDDADDAMEEEEEEEEEFEEEEEVEEYEEEEDDESEAAMDGGGFGSRPLGIR